MRRLYIDEFFKQHRGETGLIKRAVDTAVREGISTLHFGKGTYFLEDFETIRTPSIDHDDGCGGLGKKDCHLVLDGLKDFTLEGECGRDGKPATILAGVHPGRPQELLPSILWAQNTAGLTVKNLAFTREPECASAGRIERVDGANIYVRVFPGNPCHDGMAAYCMNRFDIGRRRLLGESLTYGFGFDKRFRLAGERLLLLEDEELAAKVREGEGLSWHQAGKTDFQLFFGQCDGLILENIRVYNTNSFAILTENCKDISAERVVIKPKGNQFFTGPRDGWKIYRCTGRIEIRECWIEGVRMDGQNVHSNFLALEERISPKELLCLCKYAPLPLRDGYGLRFYDGDRMETRTIESWEITGGFEEENRQSKGKGAAMSVLGARCHRTLYRIRLTERIPDFAGKGTLMTAKCWEPEQYICRDTMFVNVAGAGHLLRCGKVKISGCTYQDMMNGGILIGAELDTHCEGGHGVDVELVGNHFYRCGTKPRYGEAGMGCIAVKSQGFQGPVNQRIKIRGNLFCDSRRALEIRDARDVEIRDNLYRNIEEKRVTDNETTEAVRDYDSIQGGWKK